MPMVSEDTDGDGADKQVSRLPNSMRENTSRPNSSVPSRWARLGARKRLPTPILIGE